MAASGLVDRNLGMRDLRRRFPVPTETGTNPREVGLPSVQEASTARDARPRRQDGEILARILQVIHVDRSALLNRFRIT